MKMMEASAPGETQRRATATNALGVFGDLRFGYLNRYEIEFEARMRPSLLYIPRGVTEPAPLLVAMHGGSGNPAAFARLTRLHEIAEREKFIVVYAAGCGRPRGRRRSWNAGGEHALGLPEMEGANDVGFIRLLIETIAGDIAIDATRIYACGLSKGGMMAYRLACEMSDLVCAIAVVAGAMCLPCPVTRRRVSVLHIHGADDENVPLGGGKGRRTAIHANWPAPREGIDFWRKADACEPETHAHDAATKVDRYLSLTADRFVAVEYCIVNQSAHGWPGGHRKLWQMLLGARLNNRFKASSEIWRFLRDKRRTA